MEVITDEALKTTKLLQNNFFVRHRLSDDALTGQKKKKKVDPVIAQALDDP